jgi:hypothetical protein
MTIPTPTTTSIGTETTISMVTTIPMAIPPIPSYYPARLAGI